MTSKVFLKPSVWKADDGAWVAELDHISWLETRDFDSWDKALRHALWIGWCAGVWGP